MTSVRRQLRQNSEPSSSVVIERQNHATTILSQLSIMRADRSSTDTVLVAGNTEVLCHRAVLAASSPYFQAMFCSSLKESQQQRIKIDGVSALALSRLVDYIYTGRIEVSVDDAQDLLAAASLFQYLDVVETCCRFLKTHLHPANCLGIESFGNHHNCMQLASDAHRFVVENFEAVAAESDEFLELSAQRLESYISSDSIEVRTEELVFEAVCRWVNADHEKRHSAACKLMEHIRFTLVSSEYIQSNVLPHTIISKCQQCTALVSGTTKVLSSRPSTIAKQVMVVVGGRGNGVDEILTSVEVYNPLKRCWKELPDIPSSVLYCSVTALGNNIYVTGGVVDGRAVAGVWQFVSERQQWRSAPEMPAPRAHHSSASVNKRLYVVGGTRSATKVDGELVVDSIECLDVSAAEPFWSTVTTVPCPRLGSHIVALGDSALVEVGGLQVGAGIVSTIELYSCSGESGQLVYSGEQFVLPEPVNRAQAAALAGVLYIIWTDTGRVISLNADRRIFRRLADLRRTHVGGSATVLGNCVYMTGGCVGNEGVDRCVEMYDTEANTWVDVAPMCHARSNHGCVTIYMR